MSAFVTGPGRFEPCPSYTPDEQRAIAALTTMFREPSIPNISAALCAIARAVPMDDFCLATLAANSEILFLADDPITQS